MKLKEYEVLYVEPAENTVYICRKMPESKLYRVIETTDRTRIAKYIEYFVLCKSTVFCEDFCLNEKYYAVFRNPDGIPLKASEEKLTAQKAVRALAMQNPPLEIAVKILSADHVFVCGEELEFAYDLPETDVKITREYFFGQLADFVNSLWETDGNRHAEKWLADLRGGKFENLLNAYRCMPDPTEKEDFSDREHLKKIKAILPKAAAVIAAAAVITAAALALDQSEEAPAYDRIDSLGTIDLTEI